MKLIAVDPGASGGIAIEEDGVVRAQKLPEETILLEMLRNLSVQGFEKLYIESQTGWGPEIQRGMFEFGRHYGFVIGAASALGYQVIKVTPLTWQKVLNLGFSGRVKSPHGATDQEKANARKLNTEAKALWKNKLKQHAQSRYPNAKVTLAICDALLLLDYAVQVEGGNRS